MLTLDCNFQMVSFDETRQVYISVCGQSASLQAGKLVGAPSCAGCGVRQVPTVATCQDYAIRFPTPLARRSAVLRQLLYEEYCQGCSFLVSDTGCCEQKDPDVPIDAFIALNNHHCPLERW